MARQQGSVKLSGRIGDVLFYKSPHGWLARGAGSLNKERLRRDPAFAATRSTGEEFGRVSQAGKLLRSSVQRYARYAKDYSTNYRLNTALVEVLKEDTIHERGQRRLSSTELGGLQGFEWNSQTCFSEAFRPRLKITIDRQAGQALVRCPRFRTADSIAFPHGASHCQLTAILLAPDFDGNHCTAFVADGGLWTPDQPVPAHTLQCNFPAGTQLPLLLCLDIRFFTAKGEALTPLKQGEALVVAAVAAVGF